VYLVDTDVLSVMSPASKAPAAERERIGRSFVAVGYVSVISLGEIQLGASLLAHKGATRRASDLAAWLDRLLARFAERIVGIDIPTARLAGELEAVARASGHDPGAEDTYIAACAQRHDLTVVTYNLRHFTAFGVPCRSPD
jgi:hypothetical protein